LSKIDRGEEVKLETLQQVANKLQVPEGHFSHPVPAPADDSEVSSVLEPGTIMMRKLDWARLEELLKGAENLRWSLNAQVRDEATRTLLEDFEQAVENFRKQLDLDVPHAWDGDPTLRFQLNRLKASDDLAERARYLRGDGRGSDIADLIEDREERKLGSLLASSRVIEVRTPFPTDPRRIVETVRPLL